MMVFDFLFSNNAAGSYSPNSLFVALNFLENLIVYSSDSKGLQLQNNFLLVNNC